MSDLTAKTPNVDWSAVMALIALGAFMMVSLIIFGGWLFSVTWNIFVVPVFGLPMIDIGQGFSALFMTWAIGSALGLRKNATPQGK